jgi:hypothetical protein
VCGGGVSESEWEALVEAGPYITQDKITDPINQFVATSSSMAVGGWTTNPFQIVGQDDTCGNKTLISHNSNPSAVILPSGLVVLAYRRGARFATEIYTRGYHWFPHLLA